MISAPTDRKLARVVRDTALGNFATQAERAMLLGPRGEVREVFTPGDPAFLATRERMIRSKELSAVAYLRASGIEGLAQLAVTEFFEDGKRSVFLLLVEHTGHHWSALTEKDVDQWIQQRYVKKGGDEETTEK